MFVNNKLLYLTFSFTMWNQLNANSKFVLRSDNPNMYNLLSDMPLGDYDLHAYLRALEGIVEFSSENSDSDLLDAQYYFTLYLVNNCHPAAIHGGNWEFTYNADIYSAYIDYVQLKRIRFLKSRPSTSNYLAIPKLAKIIGLNDKLLKKFRIKLNSAREIDDSMPEVAVLQPILLKLINNGKEWTERLDEFNFGLLQSDHPERLRIFQSYYPDWSHYVHTVSVMDEFSPSPMTSGLCLGSLLTEKSEGDNNEIAHCDIPPLCKDMVVTGNPYGFFVTQRLMYLLVANIGKGCYIFNSELDKDMRKMFCGLMYVEASYIADNGYKLPQLMLEQMSLCSLDGHAQFLRRSWLDNLLTFQGDTGCFEMQSGLENLVPKRLGTCDLLATANAANALAGAIRYTVEGSFEENHDFNNDTVIEVEE